MKFLADYRRLVGYVKPHLGTLLLAIFFMILSSITDVLSLGMIIPLVDRIIRGQKIILTTSVHVPQFISNIVDRLNSIAPVTFLTNLVIFAIVVTIIKELFRFFQVLYMKKTSQCVIRDLRNVMYDKLLNLSLDFYSKASTGKLASRIIYDTGAIQDSISEGLSDLLFQPIQLVGYLILAVGIKIYFSIPWWLVFVSVVVLPTIIYPIIQVGRRLRKISTQTQEKIADLNAVIYESLSGIRIVKAFSMEGYERNKFFGYNSTLYKKMIQSLKRSISVNPLTELVGVFCVSVLLFFGGRAVLGNAISAGALFGFIAALMSIAKPVQRLSKVHTINQQALAAASRIFEILDMPVSVAETKEPANLPVLKNYISFEDVSFAYEGEVVLKDINLNVHKGEVIAFVGPSGGGKTTLVNLIPRFYDPQKGHVGIDGIDIRRVSFRSLRDQIGLVTQETILFNDTVAINIAYGRGDVSIDKIMDAAKVANAHDFISRLPLGYDTIVGERGFKLSGGEKQRLAIARAILKDPPILILDEATSQLDTESERLVQEAIDRLMANRTVFVIAHRLSTIRHAHRILVIENGRIVEEGSHERLMAMGGVYKRLYELQFSIVNG